MLVIGSKNIIFFFFCAGQRVCMAERTAFFCQAAREQGRGQMKPESRTPRGQDGRSSSVSETHPGLRRKDQ